MTMGKTSIRAKLARTFATVLVSGMAVAASAGEIRLDASATNPDANEAQCDSSGEILIGCPAGCAGEFEIPDGVRFVADGAFAGCGLLTQVFVPQSVTYIGAGAFADCVSLATILIPGDFPFDIDSLGLPETCEVLRYRTAFAASPVSLRGVGTGNDGTPPAQYTVRFNANGGSGSMADITCTWDVPRALPGNAFTRTGFSFGGWARSAGGAVVFKNGQTVVNLTTATNSTVVLYAKWTGIRYTVVFHEKDKGKTVSQQLVYGTGTALQKNQFKKSGHVFMGWAKTPEGSVAYKDRAVVSKLATKSGARVHLYARWAVKNYTVRFMANGGKGSMADQRFVYGTETRLRANAFKRTGFTFTGWARKPKDPVKYSNKEALSTLTPKGGVVVFYAKWKRNRYTVVFDANGANGSMADQTQYYDKKVQLPLNAFKYSGRVFMGWARSRDGKVKYKDGATVKTLSSRNGAVVRLFARWAVRRYSVRFNANGGTGSMDDEAFVYGAKAKALTRNSFSRSNHIFIGWSRSASAKEAEFADRQSVQNLTTDGGVVTFYAIWKKVGDPNIVLCLGDSITEGYRCIGLPYPSRLAQLSGRSVRNYGKGGKLASYGASIAEDALRKENPGIVCILFGANDAIHHVSPSATKENLRKIIRLCRQYNAKPIIATPTPQIGSHARFNSGVKAIASQVRSLAREENVSLVDLNSAFGDGKKYLNPADGLHLSDAGGSLMAREFYKAF